MDRARTRAPAAAALVAAVAAVLVMAGGTQSSPGHPYLALGDSVTFGYITQAGFEYRNPDNFIGFPAYVGDALGMTPTNAACPGETTAGFISGTGADNGCRPFRANFPLHTGYQGTQLAFATGFLDSHPNTKLVTIADEFSTFAAAAALAGGKTCVAGLLNTTPGNQATCDVHPSQSGQQLLGRTVAAAFDNG